MLSSHRRPTSRRIPRSRLALSTGAIAVTSALVLSACGGSSPSSSSSEDKGAADLTVVTSTNVYSDIVSQVAGDKAEVTPIIDDPNQNPHEYEATSQDRLKLSKADLVVENGGGYDAFMTTMLEASDADPEIIDAVSISGLPGSEGVDNEPHDHGEEGHGHEDDEAHAGGEAHEHDGEEGHEHGEFNEHLWYSIPTMTKLVDEVATRLGQADPDDKDAFTANAEAYHKKLDGLQKRIDAVKADHEGEKAAATEPVPLWMFQDMGLENVTSDDFLEAVEEGNDVPPLVLKKAVEQVEHGDIALLAYNTQEAGPQTDQLVDAAKKADVPVVDVAETMPADTAYLDWMGDQISQFEGAFSDGSK